MEMFPTQEIKKIPVELDRWIHDHNGSAPLTQVGRAPYEDKERAFLLTTVPLSKLSFTDNTFNPRTPSEKKVNELAASITSLSLLTPLTCAFHQAKLLPL